MDTAESSNLDFSLTRGGPLFALLTSTRILGKGKYAALRPGLAFAAVTWLPMAFLAALRWLGDRTVDPVVRDPAVHVRLLLAIPLFFVAEALLEERCAWSFRHLVEGHLPRAAATRIAATAGRLRDSRLAELLALAVGVTSGQSALWGFWSASGAMPGVGMGEAGTASFEWYAAVSVPIFQFLLLRSLYRWAIWSWMLISLSRLDLALEPTHPDLAGGIAFVGDPVEAFALIVFAASGVVAATWGHRLDMDAQDLKRFASPFVLLVTIVIAMAFGPLLCFSVRLWRVRLEGMRRFTLFASGYTKGFREKWLDAPQDDALLGSPDIQGLADLGNSFDKLEHMRFVPFGPRLVIIVFAAALVPMVPLLAMVQPLPELFTNLGRSLLGGLPH